MIFYWQTRVILSIQWHIEDVIKSFCVNTVRLFGWYRRPDRRRPSLSRVAPGGASSRGEGRRAAPLFSAHLSNAHTGPATQDTQPDQPWPQPTRYCTRIDWLAVACPGSIRDARRKWRSAPRHVRHAQLAARSGARLCRLVHKDHRSGRPMPTRRQTTFTYPKFGK